MITVIPAGGRSYSTGSQALEAWNSDKDFTVADETSEHYGAKINRSDARTFLRGEDIRIQYGSEYIVILSQK